MNIHEAAERLGVSTRAVRRYIAKKRLTPNYVKGPHGLEAEFDPAQVEELKQEMARQGVTALMARAPVTVEKPGRSEVTGKGSKASGVTLTAEQLAQLLDYTANQAASRVIEGVGEKLSQVMRQGRKMVLTLAEASQESGLSRDKIRAACQAGHLGRREGRRWRIKRTELRRYVAGR